MHTKAVNFSDGFAQIAENSLLPNAQTKMSIYFLRCLILINPYGINIWRDYNYYVNR